MAHELQKLDKRVINGVELLSNELTTEIVTDHKYGEECGYRIGYELIDMDDVRYPITPLERQQIIQAMNNPIMKVIDLGKTILATHQIKKIEQYKTWFGPRSGGA